MNRPKSSSGSARSFLDDLLSSDPIDPVLSATTSTSRQIGSAGSASSRQRKSVRFFDDDDDDEEEGNDSAKLDDNSGKASRYVFRSQHYKYTNVTFPSQTRETIQFHSGFVAWFVHNQPPAGQQANIKQRVEQTTTQFGWEQIGRLAGNKW